MHMEVPPWLPQLRQQLLGALDPWISALSTHARFSYDTDTSHGQRPLTVDISTDGAVDVRVFEAIELLALLGGVDPRLFTIHVYSAAMRHSSWLRLPETTALPIKCVLRIRHGANLPTAITAWCERLVLGGVEATASKEYANMRSLLEATYKMVDIVTPPGVTRVARDSLVVRVEVQATQGDFEERVAQLSQVAVMQHARDTMRSRVFHHHQWKSIFRVTQMAPGIPRSISAKAFLHLAQIVSCGIDMDHLWVYNMDIEAETAAVFAQGLQLLMRTPMHDEASALACGRLKEIELPQYMTEQTVSAVFSALMVSQSIQTLTINHEAMPWEQELPSNRSMTREQRAHLWKWISIALFSRYAAHRLKTIRFHVQDLNEDDMAAFRAALYRPEAAIASPPVSMVDDMKPFEKITASRFMLTPPLPSMDSAFGWDVDLGPQDVLIEDRAGAVENPNWLRAVLPGCGRGWVHRSNITPIVSNQDHYTAPSPNLTIAYMNDRSKPAVLELLQLICRDVKNLYIVNCTSREPLDDWLLSVVEACPRLESLAMANSGSVTSMDVFVKMYDHESCQIKSLQLTDVRIDSPESIPHFMTLLRADTLRMSKQLQQLSLTTQAVGAPLNMVPVIDAMLTSNVTLEDLHMCVSYEPNVAAENFATVSAVAQRHLGKPVAVRLAPLSVEKKYAFISTMTSSCRENHPASRAMRRMDHRVLSLIFEYAAECKKRRVSLWFHTEANAGDDIQELAGAEDENEDEQVEVAFVGGADNDRED